MIIVALAAALVAQQPAPSADPEGSEPGAGSLYAPPPVRPYEMPAALAAELSGWSPPPEGPLRPVSLEAYARSYEGAPDPLDQRFLIGVESARLAMDSRMGPLDGPWLLEDADGRPLYALVLADPAPGGGVEGAWRALTGPEAARPSGVIATAVREGESLSASFVLPGRAEPARLRLQAAGDGWRGRLTEPDGRSRQVMLRRG